MTDIDNFRKEVKKLSKSLEWWIEAASAVVAALASLIAAFYSYSAQMAVANINREISKTTSAFDIYKSFIAMIIKGDKDQRCRALLLISAVEPQAGVKLINTELAKQLKCDEQPRFNESIKASLGTQCRSARPTKTTLHGFTTQKQIDQARAIRKEPLTIPKKFEGPWPDGTISFTSQKSVDGQEVWCNCLPNGI